MKCEFRQATPDDANVAVPLIYSSGPAAFDFVFAGGSHRTGEDFLHYAFTRRDGEFGFANHSVAVCNGEVVGVGACFTTRKALAFTVTAVRQIVFFYGVTRSIGVVRRGLQIEQVFRLPHRNKDYLGHLGVTPAWQSRGVGRSLIRHFLNVGKDAGQTHAVLDVSTENPRARALYERLGFQPVEERTSTLPGVPNHLRMELPL